MNIAVNAFFLPGSFPESGSHFIITSFTSIAAQFPEHQFIFITDKATLFTFPSEKNCTNIIVGPEIKNSLRLKGSLFSDVTSMTSSFISSVTIVSVSTTGVSTTGVTSVTAGVTSVTVSKGSETIFPFSESVKNFVIFLLPYELSS
ncbi:MAG: hypothetical protein WCG67_03235 [Ferruginibacter sp.]